MRFAFVRTAAKAYPVAVLCRVLQVSRSGYYAWCRRPPSARTRADGRDRVAVRAAFVASKGRYGAPRIVKALARQGQVMGTKRAARLLRAEQLVARPKRRFRCTTDSRHQEPMAPNLVARQFTAPGPNHTWVADTTELRAGGERLFLAAVVDLFSRMVVGWALSRTNDAALTTRALREALARRRPTAGLIHHSDRGSTYTCQAMQALLRQRGCRVSMSGTGNCYDNAAMESWFSTLKTELGDTFSSVAAAQRELTTYIELFYNHQRLHSTLDYVSPAAYERTAARRLVA